MRWFKKCAHISWAKLGIRRFTYAGESEDNVRICCTSCGKEKTVSYGRYQELLIKQRVMTDGKN